MNITDVKIRLICDGSLIAIASITIDTELTINDIKIWKSEKSDHYKIKLPNSNFAKNNNQYSLSMSNVLYNKVKDAIIDKMNIQQKGSTHMYPYTEIEARQYRFFPPTGKKNEPQNLITTIVADIYSIKADEPERAERFNVQVVSKLDNPQTYQDYLQVDFIYSDEELAKADEEALANLKSFIEKSLYVSTFLKSADMQDKFKDKDNKIDWY